MNETIINAKSVFVVLRLAFAKRLDCGVFSAAILRSRAVSQFSLKIGKEVLWRAAEYGMAMSGDVQKRRSTAAVQTLPRLPEHIRTREAFGLRRVHRRFFRAPLRKRAGNFHND